MQLLVRLFHAPQGTLEVLVQNATPTYTIIQRLLVPCDQRWLNHNSV